MIREELIESGQRVHHWSDTGYKIVQVETGIVYDDAVDIVPCRYTYEETGEPVEKTTPNIETTDIYMN